MARRDPTKPRVRQEHGTSITVNKESWGVCESCGNEFHRGDTAVPVDESGPDWTLDYWVHESCPQVAS